MFKNMILVILFDMFLSPSFKMTIGFANIASYITYSLLFIDGANKTRLLIFLVLRRYGLACKY